MTFFQSQYIALRASVPLGGCARVVLYDAQELGVHSRDELDTLYAQFEAAAGMSASDVWSVSPATQPPYAPVPTFPTSLWGYPPHVFATVTPTP
jgi:hypothetical protein